MSEIPEDINDKADIVVGRIIEEFGDGAVLSSMRRVVADAILAEREVSHKRGLREGIDEALQIAVEQAGLMADLALEGVEENARVREAMEAALTRFSQKLAVTLADLSHPTLTDEAKLRRSQALDELGALDGELI